MLPFIVPKSTTHNLKTDFEGGPQKYVSPGFSHTLHTWELHKVVLLFPSAMDLFPFVSKKQRKEKGGRPSLSPHHDKPDHDTYYDAEELVSKVRDEGVEWVLPRHDHQPSILQWPSNGFKTLIGSLTFSIMTFKESHNLFGEFLNPCSLIILLYMVKVNYSMCKALFYIQNTRHDNDFEHKPFKVED